MSTTRQARSTDVSGALDSLCEWCRRYPAHVFTDDKLLCCGCFPARALRRFSLPSLPGYYYLGKDGLYYFDGVEKKRTGTAA